MSKDKEHIISVDSLLCSRCGACSKDCPRDLWTITETGAKTASRDSHGNLNASYLLLQKGKLLAHWCWAILP